MTFGKHPVSELQRNIFLHGPIGVLKETHHEICVQIRCLWYTVAASDPVYNLIEVLSDCIQ